MNSDVKKGMMIAGIFAVGIIFIVFFVLHRGYKNDLDTTKANAAAEINQINHVEDSLKKENVKRADTIRLLGLQVDTLNGRYQLLKATLVTESHDLNQLRQLYNNLNLGNISNFNSDSILQYFKNNFDSTKIITP